jgi:arylformamidase
MNTMTPEGYSRAYNNRLLVPDFQNFLRLWDKESARARQALQDQRLGHWNLSYGPRPLNTLDLIQPSLASMGDGAPILIFIHGGYWRMLDKSAQTFIAPRLSQRGAMVVIPNYSLAPSVGLQDISLDIAQAVAWVWAHARQWGGDPRRIVVAGHSAGGHLTAMALSCRFDELGRALGLTLPRQLSTRGVAISGLFDLAPLVHCEWLMPDIRLTAESIQKLSPARWAAPRGCRLTAVAGEFESGEFHRQNRVIEQAWGARAVHRAEPIAQCNHFSVLLDVMHTESRLSALMDEALGLQG